MLENNSGSASILFMFGLFPFVLVASVVAVELTQFLGVREEVQRIVDEEARQSLARPISQTVSEQRLRSDLRAMSPRVSIVEVRALTGNSRGEISVKGIFSGAIGELIGWVAQQNIAAIPFVVSARVRRLRTVAFILLDRSVTSAANICRDKKLQQRANLAADLRARLERLGVERAIVGVTPGVNEQIEIVSESDRIPRCPEITDASPLRIESIQGATPEAVNDAVGVSYQAAQMFFKQTAREFSRIVEQRAMIVIAPDVSSRAEIITNTFSLLDVEAGKNGERVRAVGIVLGEGGDISDFNPQVGVASGRAKYFHISDREISAGLFQVALASHIQGQVFLAR